MKMLFMLSKSDNSYLEIQVLLSDKSLGLRIRVP